MPECFAVGKRYPRARLTEWMKSDVKFNGIIHNAAERPGVVICTSGGDYSEVAGFRDGPTTDGCWHYGGQRGGRRGPRNAAGNRKVRESQVVLLFTAHKPTAEELARDGRGQQYRFEGSFRVRDEKMLEQGERELDTDTWQIVGERLLFIFEPCDPAFGPCVTLREQRLLA
jgi:hypothetical protein